MTYRSTILADLPLAYLRLGDAAGTTALDGSPNARNGTYSGTVALGVGGALKTDTDTGASFDGSSGIVSLANPAAVQLTTGSVEAWVRTTGTGVAAVACKANAYGLFVNGTVAAFRDFNTSSFISGSVVINDGQWHYLVSTFQSGVGSGAKLYVDNALDATGTMTVVDNTHTLYLAQNEATQYLGGAIDEFAVYSTVLSVAQIAAHWAASQTLVLSGTLALIPAVPTWNTSDNRILVCNSGSGNHLRVTALQIASGTNQTGTAVSCLVTLTDANGLVVLQNTSLAYTSAGQWDLDVPSGAFVRGNGPWSLLVRATNPDMSIDYHTFARTVIDGGG